MITPAYIPVLPSAKIEKSIRADVVLDFAADGSLVGVEVLSTTPPSPSSQPAVQPSGLPE